MQCGIFLPALQVGINALIIVFYLIFSLFLETFEQLYGDYPYQEGKLVTGVSFFE